MAKEERKGERLIKREAGREKDSDIKRKGILKGRKEGRGNEGKEEAGIEGRKGGNERMGEA